MCMPEPDATVMQGHGYELKLVTTAGLGQAVPILNGVTSLTDQASSLNTTAANINSLVASGTHVVAQVQSKGIEVSFTFSLQQLQEWS